MVGALRLSIPHVQYFKSDIENLLKQTELKDLSFSHVELEWGLFDHLIHLRNVTLTKANDIDPVVDRLSLEINLWSSLKHQSLVIHKIVAVVDALTISKDQKKHWWLSDISLNDLIPAQKTLGNAVLLKNDRQLWLDFFQRIELAPQKVHLEVKQVTINDEKGAQQYKIVGTVLKMQRLHGEVRATLNTNLQSLGGQLSIQAIISDQKGVLYSELEDLNFSPQLVSLFDIDIAGLQQAKVTNAKVWLNLDSEKQPVIRTNFSIDNGQYQGVETSNAEPQKFSFDTRLSIQPLQKDWRIIGQVNGLVLNETPTSGFETQLNLSNIENKMNLSGWIKSLDLSIVTLLGDNILSDGVPQKVLSNVTSGKLDNTWFNLDPTNLQSLSLTSQLNHLVSNPVAGVPGFNDLSASLIIGNQNLMFKSTGRQLTLDFEDSFRAPIEVDRYTFKASASLDEAGVHISVPKFELSNSDISLTGRLLLDFDQGDAPFMYLRASFDQANAASKSKYLPVKLLPKKVIRWLDESIKDAEISAGNVLYHGRLKTIRTLDNESSGGFHVDFQMNNATFMFNPNWATMKKVKSTITFNNFNFMADISSANFSQIDDVHGQVLIPDLTKPIINLNLHANTQVSSALPTWLSMPTSKSFRPAFSQLENMSGQVEINTGLVMPLSKVSNSIINVGLSFKNAGVNSAVWDFELQQLNGDLLITQNQIFGKDIKANFFDDPITINVNRDQIKNKTLIQADGLIKTQKIMSLLPAYLSKGVSGKSDWQVQFAIDHKQTNDGEPSFSINSQSNLKSTKIELPKPFFKPANISQKTTIAIDIYGNKLIDFDFRYGPNIAVRGDLGIIEGNAKYQLKSMDVALSTPFRPIVANSGVRLYGFLPTLSIDDWIEWHQTEIGQFDTKPKTDSNQSEWDVIQFVDLQLQSARVKDQQWSDVDFFMMQEVDEFLIDIKSSHLSGKITIPKQASSGKSITADLKHVKFESQESSESESTLLPGDFYSLKLMSKLAKYDDYAVENLRIETRRDNNKLVIQKFDFQQDKIFLHGKGLWEYEATNQQHITSLNFELKGSKFGQTMVNLGLGNSIDDGNIELNSHFTWSNSLLNFDWDSLTGNANFILKDGVLKNVEPGSGRLIGLLSLNALPRRLLLGFSDVLAKGLEFDKISGSYIIDGENLITNDTYMDSTSAKVLVTGSTGLRSQIYDQKMFITPKVRQTLPLLGGIIAGAGVGWGLLLLEKVFKSAIDKTVEIKYLIKGTWDDPKIILMDKPKLNWKQ